LLRQRKDPGHGHDRESGGEAKVFCFFSSEKKALSYHFARNGGVFYIE
jgi:hypothetical protein